MKIGFLTTYFYPVTGGAENNCFYLARELAKKHEVHIFTSNKKNGETFPSEEIKDNIQIHRFNTILRHKYYLALYPSVIKAISKADLDILHVQSLGFVMHDLTVVLKKLKGKTKLVNTPHGPFMALPSYPLTQKILKKVMTFAEKPFNTLYDAVIQVNPSQYLWMTQLGFKKEKIHFIPNGIPEEIFKLVPKKQQWKNKLVISYVGRIQEYKGIDQIIQILPEFPKMVFIAIGQDAGDKQRLSILAQKLKVQDRVIFTGRIDEDKKLQILDESEIFIMPSQWEAFGIAMLEAMARSNAIISTTTEGGQFLVTKENGYLYKYGDVKTLAKHLEALQDTKIRKAMQKANKEKAKQFTWDKIAKQVEELYFRLNNN